MSKEKLIFELSPKNPNVSEESILAQLMTYGGYTYSEEHTQTDQYEESKITLMGRANYEKNDEIEEDYWKYAYVEIKMPMLIIPSGTKVYFKIKVKAEETTNKIQIFGNKKLLKTVPLKAREEEEIHLDFQTLPRRLDLLLRPVYPYPRPFSFFSLKMYLK
ncbi:MAG: hypothetical protein ACXABI_09890 [Candidatus Hodarchaeales archaeon]|jgi:hypothetical protein